MGCLEVVGESLVCGAVLHRRLEPLGGRAPFRGEPTNRYPIASDNDGLTALDLIKNIREVPRRRSAGRAETPEPAKARVVGR